MIMLIFGGFRTLLGELPPDAWCREPGSPDPGYLPAGRTI